MREKYAMDENFGSENDSKSGFYISRGKGNFMLKHIKPMMECTSDNLKIIYKSNILRSYKFYHMEREVAYIFMLFFKLNKKFLLTCSNAL